MFRFANPEILYLLLIIPVLLIFYWVMTGLRKRALKRFGNPVLLKGLMPDASHSKLFVKFMLSLLAMIALIFAMARPQFGSKLQEVKRKGVEIVIALDVSNSMLAEDIQPNRLEKAKRAISRLLSKLENDKVGLIVFAGDAYVQLPITTDYTAAKIFLNTIDPDIVPKQGTAIGSAIDLGIRSFSSESELNKALIIITDGENHEGNALEAVKKASEKGIIVHAIGMGSPEGAPIPVSGRYGSKSFRKDRQGNTVISKLNEKMLQDIALEGNGAYIRANNVEIGLNTIFNEINKMEKKEIESKIYSEYDDQFPWIVGIALFFLVIDAFVLERKNKWLKQLNLFGGYHK